MTFAIETIESTAVVAITGRFDAHHVDRFRDLIDTARASGVKRFVLDLSATIFIDTTALQALDAAQAGCADPGDFVLAAPSQPLQIILELTGLSNRFTMRRTVTRALDGVPVEVAP